MKTLDRAHFSAVSTDYRFGIRKVAQWCLAMDKSNALAPVVIILVVVVLACSGGRRTEPEKTTQTPASAPAISTPYFNAAALAGKTPREVQQLLGRTPSDSWDSSDDGPEGYMQAYSIGEDMTVEFRGNRIDSLVIFFPNDVNRETAHSL